MTWNYMDEPEERITSETHPELVGKRVAKLCPNGHAFVIRANREDDSLFLGCSHFPDCRETSEIPLELLLRMAGVDVLPGFE